MARTIDTPIITGGHVKRLEDVKKYLYVGAAAVYLDVPPTENVDLMKEASDRFGSEKIFAYLPELSYLNSVEEYIQLGASKIIVDVAELNDGDLAKIGAIEEEFLVFCDDDGARTITSYLKGFVYPGSILTAPGEKEGNCMLLKQELKARGIVVDTFESAVCWEEFKLNSDGLIR